MNMKLERRPVAILELTELDKNYIYSKRVIYVDMETLMFFHGDYYDQKGRKWRTLGARFSWMPEYGNPSGSCAFIYSTDWVDLHSEPGFDYLLPANYPPEAVSMRALLKRAK